MKDWKSNLKADPTEWLLEEEDSSVRYFALKDILDKPENDRAVQAAKSGIMRKGMVPKILEMQRDEAYIKKYPAFYTDKYRGLVWQLVVLAELGATADGQICEECEYILDNAQVKLDGGFSQHASAREGGGRQTEVVPCLTGNMVWSLERLGYGNDPRVQKGIGWLMEHMHINDGNMEDPQAPPYDHARFEACWGAHTCHMGVVKAMKGLSAIPKEKRTDEINGTIQKCAEFMLMHHVYKRSHNLSRASKPGWLKFGFPLMYQTDALEILDILTELGYCDSRMQDAVNAVLGKQNENGKWMVENTYSSDRLLIPFGRAGEESKWITLRALRVLKRYNTKV